MTLPPGSLTLPVLGATLDIAFKPLEYFRSQVARYGPVFRTNYLSSHSIVLTGAEAQKLVLLNKEGVFLNKEGYAIAEQYIGGTLIMSDGDAHDIPRRIMTPAFHGKAMLGYLERINGIINHRFARWGDAGAFAFHTEANSMAFELAAGIMLGVDRETDLKRLSALWHRFSDGINGIVQVNVPLTAYGRGLAAKRKMNRLLARLLADQRKEPNASVASLLLHAEEDEDGQLTDEQIVAQLRLLMLAGYDTTTGTLAWTMVELLRNPSALERLRDEVAAGGEAPLTVEDLSARQRPYLEAVLNETIRLHPQVPVFTRGLARTIVYSGYELPSGWLVHLPSVYTHRMADYFTEPDRFDPERFLPPREEHKVTPYAFVGFGSGAHQCLGEGIARIEMKAILIRILRRYEFRLVPNQDFTPLYLPRSRPKAKVVVSYSLRRAGVAV